MTYQPEFPSSDLGQDAQAWLARELEAIQLEIQKRVLAGHTGLSLSAPVAVTETISGAATKVTGFDQKLSLEEAAFADIANSNIIFLGKGLWSVNCQLVLEITASSANDTREIYVQLFNETDTTVLDIIATESVPRYGGAVTISSNYLADVNIDLINKAFSLYVYSPSGHIIDVTELQKLRFSVHRVSKEG